MIRVLHVVTSMEKGGIENMLMNFYRRIDRDKVQFDFLIHAEKRADFEDEIESLGGRIYRTEKRSLMNFGRYLGSLESFFRSHGEYKIVHAHMDTLSAFVLFAAKRAGVPVRISHSHSTASKHNSLKKLVNDFCRLGINSVCTDRFACSEEAGKYLFGKKACDIGEVTLINNGIDCDKFAFNKKMRESVREKLAAREELLIAHVGSFIEVKNQKFIVKILSELKRNGIPAKAVFIGEGETLGKIKAHGERLGVSDSLIFTGAVPNVYDFLNAADVFVFPSLFEGLPLSLVEAQANGLKIYCSDSVPQKADLTGAVEFLPLSLGAEAWAEKIKAAMPFERTDAADIIKEKGFDSLYSAKQLEKFYLEKWC